MSSNANRGRKLVVRSALVASSTIAVLAGAEALMIQDTHTNTANAAQIEQSPNSDDFGENQSNYVTVRSSNGITYVRPSRPQSFPYRTRSSR